MIINGERIKQKMRKKHITQQKLADAIRKDRSEISHWIRRRRGVMAKEIFAISDFLGIPVEEITDGEPVKFPEMVSVVRCINCKWHTMRDEMLLCTAQDKPHTYDWFCADGEQKEGLVKQDD